MIKLKFKGSGSFPIRSGWFEKTLYVLNENRGKNIFANKSGGYYLGVGANMVASIRYWLNAAGIYDSKTAELTSFGSLISERDKYFENINTWWLIHYNLVSNLIDCPVFYSVFNKIDEREIGKDDLRKRIKLFLDDYSLSGTKAGYIDDDLSVFLRSYTVDDSDMEKSPEDNTICPLSYLDLVEKENNIIRKNQPVAEKLNYKVVYYSLIKAFSDRTASDFTIDEALTVDNGPGRVFNLDRYSMLVYIEEMSKHDLVTFSRTAGLDAVYFNKKKSLEDALKDIFE